MKKYKFILLFLLFLFVINTVAFAQGDTTKSKVTIDFSADLFSRYVWRGTQFGGNSPSIQPGISFSYNNLEAGVWGAYSIGGDNPSQEVDLYLSYSFFNELFSTVVTDYYFPSDAGDYRYFEYNKDNTGHIFEAGLLFNGTKKIPVKFSAYVNFLGADVTKLNDNPSDPQFNKKTGIQYSNYFELGFEPALKAMDMNIFMGFTLSNPKKPDNKTGFMGEAGFYGTGPGVVNLGFTVSKSVKVTKNYFMPLTASLITNPQAQKIYLLFGISF